MKISFKKRVLIICAYLGPAVCGLGGFASPVSAQDAPASKSASLVASAPPATAVLSDGELQKRVKAALHADPYFYDKHVTVSVERGAVVLRGLLRPAEVEGLRAGIDANLAHPSPRAKVASSAEDPGWFLEDFCCWQENAHYRNFIFSSAHGEVAAGLMGSCCARLWR